MKFRGLFEVCALDTVIACVRGVPGYLGPPEVLRPEEDSFLPRMRRMKSG